MLLPSSSLNQFLSMVLITDGDNIQAGKCVVAFILSQPAFRHDTDFTDGDDIQASKRVVAFIFSQPAFKHDTDGDIESGQVNGNVLIDGCTRS